MSMKVAHNIPAINTNKNLYNSNRAMNSSLEKLSSGYRINSGKDAPADLVISEQLRAQEAGLSRAIRNTTESINVMSVAEGALNEMNNILKKMKALAVHAANNGITSPDQIAADQAEMDSGIQTLERIAGTTKFSDQFLLNGQKEITYNAQTDVKGTQNNKLLNSSLSDFNQIFKRDGYSVSISFQGAASTGAIAGAAIADANMKAQATKAYLEIDPITGTKSQIDPANGKLTQGQSFILTGTLGSRQFDFSAGAHVSEIVTAIKNVAGSTGVNAALTFNSNQFVNKSATTTITAQTSVGLDSTALAVGNAHLFENYTTDANGALALKATASTVTATNITFGRNTDGQGNIFAKFVGNGSWEYYKDESMSVESLVGTGNATAFTARNNSGLAANDLLLTAGASAKYGDVVKINAGNIALRADAANPGTATDNIILTGMDPAAANALFDIGAAASTSTIAGVELGTNTDESGKLYFKVVTGAGGAVSEVYAYKDKLMREEDMVAKRIGTALSAGSDTVLLDSIWNDEHTASTGLSIALSTKALVAGNANSTFTFDIQFKNVGARVYSEEYGSDQFVQVQQTAGSLFTTYENPAAASSAKVIAAGDTFRLNGQDATIGVNGKQMKTRGLTLDLATQDVMANLTFNAGKTGSTTIAQVGYGEGSLFSKNTSLTFDKATPAAAGDFAAGAKNAGFNAMLNNACHNTQEIVGNFNGGMQLQLGEGAGDQNRTVVGIKNMATTNLGRIEVTGNFDKGKSVIETRSFSVQDIMGGQAASLATDPTLAMKIIEKAISDVSETRALIGAVQANMLQTNENNLRVAVENITKTESDIRDTDMAGQMTEFTKDQVLSNAGISMLSQANAMSQNVLQLLR